MKIECRNYYHRGEVTSFSEFAKVYIFLEFCQSFTTDMRQERDKIS